MLRCDARAVATVCLVMTAHAADVDPIVAVTGGRIRGLLMARGGAEFKGIPFAKAPVGDLRWREPLPAMPWTGVRDATAFGAPCPQNAANRPMDGSQEDCLFLNLWTPDWPPAARKPVMVWMHGGGNYAGSSSNASFNGESLARRGVVLVTLNYRLGILGFLAHSELTRESKRHASGNYGLMDQIAALRWVRDNIAAFGGDAGNVTDLRPVGWSGRRQHPHDLADRRRAVSQSHRGKRHGHPCSRRCDRQDDGARRRDGGPERRHRFRRVDA